MKDSVKPIESSGREDDQLLLITSQVKEHVVQIEAMVAYVLVCLVTLDILNIVVAGTRLQFLSLLVPGLFLIGLRLVVRVTNPRNIMRDIWTGASGGAGIGVTFGTAVDIAFLGATLGAGTLIGGLVGGVVGGIVGGISTDQGPQFLKRDDAYPFLYDSYKKKLGVDDLDQRVIDFINDALEDNNKIPFDKRSGLYSKTALEAFVARNLPPLGELSTTQLARMKLPEAAKERIYRATRAIVDFNDRSDPGKRWFIDPKVVRRLVYVRKPIIAEYFQEYRTDIDGLNRKYDLTPASNNQSVNIEDVVRIPE